MGLDHKASALNLVGMRILERENITIQNPRVCCGTHSKIREVQILKDMVVLLAKQTDLQTGKI
jgi:hypothetical protein